MLEALAMDVRFESRGAFTISGFATETSPATNNTDLRALWSEYKDKLAAMPEGRHGLYGVLWYTESQSFFYLLGIETAAALEGASTRVAIPAARFAVAKVPVHKTPSEAWTEFFDKELPERGFAPDAEHGKYFEYYDDNGDCELWTPVIPFQSGGAVGAIKGCEAKLRLAMINSDTGVLEALESDDLAFVNHFGQLVSKSDDIASHKQGGFKLSDIRFVSQSIRDLGDIAVVVTEAEIGGVLGGANLAERLMYTRIWQKTDGEWRLIGGQATRIEETYKS